jgi:hypothetical protein
MAVVAGEPDSGMNIRLKLSDDRDPVFVEEISVEMARNAGALILGHQPRASQQ